MLLYIRVMKCPLALLTIFTLTCGEKHRLKILTFTSQTDLDNPKLTVVSNTNADPKVTNRLFTPWLIEGNGY